MSSHTGGRGDRTSPVPSVRAMRLRGRTSPSELSVVPASGAGPWSRSAVSSLHSGARTASLGCVLPLCAAVVSAWSRAFRRRSVWHHVLYVHSEETVSHSALITRALFSSVAAACWSSFTMLDMRTVRSGDRTTEVSWVFCRCHSFATFMREPRVPSSVCFMKSMKALSCLSRLITSSCCSITLVKRRSGSCGGCLGCCP